MDKNLIGNTDDDLEVYYSIKDHQKTQEENKLSCEKYLLKTNKNKRKLLKKKRYAKHIKKIDNEEKKRKRAFEELITDTIWLNIFKPSYLVNGLKKMKYNPQFSDEDKQLLLSSINIFTNQNLVNENADITKKILIPTETVNAINKYIEDKSKMTKIYNIEHKNNMYVRDRETGRKSKVVIKTLENYIFSYNLIRLKDINKFIKDRFNVTTSLVTTRKLVKKIGTSFGYEKRINEILSLNVTTNKQLQVWRKEN